MILCCAQYFDSELLLLQHFLSHILVDCVYQCLHYYRTVAAIVCICVFWRLLLFHRGILSTLCKIICVSISLLSGLS